MTQSQLFESVNKLVMAYQGLIQSSSPSDSSNANDTAPEMNSQQSSPKQSLFAELRNLTDLLEEEENSDLVSGCVKDTFMVQTLVDVWFKEFQPSSSAVGSIGVSALGGNRPPSGGSASNFMRSRRPPSAAGGVGNFSAVEPTDEMVSCQALLCMQVALLRSNAPKCYEYLFQRSPEQLLSVLKSYLSSTVSQSSASSLQGGGPSTLLSGFIQLVFLSADSDKCRKVLWAAGVPQWISSQLDQQINRDGNTPLSIPSLASMYLLLRLCDSREDVDQHRKLSHLLAPPEKCEDDGNKTKGEGELPIVRVLVRCLEKLEESIREGGGGGSAHVLLAERACTEICLCITSLCTHDDASAKTIFRALESVAGLMNTLLCLARDSLRFNVPQSDFRCAITMMLLTLASSCSSTVKIVDGEGERDASTLEVTETDMSCLQTVGPKTTVELDKVALRTFLQKYDTILFEQQPTGVSLFASATVFEFALFMNSLPRHLRVVLRDHFFTDRVAFSMRMILNGVLNHSTSSGVATDSATQNLLLEGMGVSAALLRFCVTTTTNATKTLVAALSHIDVDLLVVSCNLLSFLLVDNPNAVREFLHSGALSLLHDALYDYSEGILEATFGLLRALAESSLAVSEMSRGRSNVISRTMDVLGQLTQQLVPSSTSDGKRTPPPRPPSAPPANATSHAACISAIGFLGDLRAKLHDPMLSRRAFYCLMETIDRASGSDLAISAELVMYACTSLSHGLVVPSFRPRSASNSGINVEGFRDPLLSLTLALKKYSYQPLMFPLPLAGGQASSPGGTSTTSAAFQELTTEAEERHQRTSALFISVVRVIINYANSSSDAQLRVLQDEELLETLWACYSSARQRLEQVLGILSSAQGATFGAQHLPRASIPLRRVIVTVTLPLCAYFWKTLSAVVAGNPRGASVLLRWNNGAIKRELSSRMQPSSDPSTETYAAAERHRFLQLDLEERRQLFRFSATLLSLSSPPQHSPNFPDSPFDSELIVDAAFRVLTGALPNRASIFLKGEALSAISCGSNISSQKSGKKQLAATLIYTIQECEELDTEERQQGSEGGTSSSFHHPGSSENHGADPSRQNARQAEVDEASSVANKAFKLLMVSARFTIPQVLAMVTEAVKFLQTHQGTSGLAVAADNVISAATTASNLDASESWPWFPIEPLRDVDDAHDMLVLLLPLLNGMLHHDSVCREVARSIDTAQAYFIPLLKHSLKREGDESNGGGLGFALQPSLQVLLVWGLMNLLFGTTDSGGGGNTPGSASSAKGEIARQGSREEVRLYATNMIDNARVVEDTLVPLLRAAKVTEGDTSELQGEDASSPNHWSITLVNEMKEAIYCLAERLLLLSRSQAPASLTVASLLQSNEGVFFLGSLFQDTLSDPSAKSIFLCLLQDESDLASLNEDLELWKQLKGILETMSQPLPSEPAPRTANYDRIQAQKYLQDMRALEK